MDHVPKARRMASTVRSKARRLTGRVEDQVQLLQEEATDELLVQACAHNHLVWAQRQADASGGHVLSDDGLGDVRAARIEGDQSHVVGSLLSAPRPHTREGLLRLIDLAGRTGAETLSVWATHESHRPLLDAWLGARGARRGGRPHWMVRDCSAAPEPPSAEDVARVTDFTTPDVFDDHVEPDLHCYHPDSSEAWQRMTEARPRRVWHAIQWRDGRPVGQISINVTDGDLGVVGFHDAVFVQSARMRGPGLSRADFFLRFALDLGARYIVLNAADHTAPLWRAIGFRSLGFGQTWWFSAAVLRSGPQPAEVEFAEAIGLGEVDRIGPPPGDIDAPLTNGMSPLQFAAMTGQHGSADRLLQLGATPNLLALWDLDRRHDAAVLLQANPGMIDERGSRSGKTLLHRAVERDDPDLAAFLLSAGAVSDARDGMFDATPLAWAQELRRPRVAAVLRRSGARA
ncbi:hypothetical protein GB931_03095 [Modestobacter sp. I12A-02628]|uniref:N-acetyltransferase domain-containing protein n=1 Tax=Goekera deserti TaxID=2497753 RepID=A0A7K3WCX2_9ACTN|nr:hypothetical protein [Goekera deserti]MPQ96924.1 hypothetical protein [Goekera deserti]NDI46762.1 hypothetical protein [Goekera deserti]NEL54331.1 hypothetical protein [Goekera deserti]